MVWHGELDACQDEDQGSCQPDASESYRADGYSGLTRLHCCEADDTAGVEREADEEEVLYVLEAATDPPER